jgi:hypothetical protein
MRGLAIATGLLAACGALVGAALLGMRAQVSAESASSALVLAERAAQAQLKLSKPAPAQAAPAVASSANAAPAAAPAPAALPPKHVSFRQTATYNGATVYVPEDCQGPYDVLMHFHGAQPYVKDEAQAANLDAVVAVFNAGNGAEKYAQSFQATGTLSSLLHQVELAVAPLCPGADAKPRRIALSGFSAGFAAVEKMLGREEDRARVDAALLVDGLHAGFIDPRRRQMAPGALQAFRDFGELAKQGKKLLAVTHSSIMTDGYASTTECSRFLLNALDVDSEDALVSGKSGDFSIEGFSGGDKAAHIAQFRQMDTTLLAKLRARWAKTP